MNANSSITAGDVSTALTSIADFLRYPVFEIRSASADVFSALEKRVSQLEDENGWVLALYQKEVQICLRYEDYLKSIGVDPREVRYGFPVWRDGVKVARKVLNLKILVRFQIPQPRGIKSP